MLKSMTRFGMTALFSVAGLFVLVAIAAWDSLAVAGGIMVWLVTAVAAFVGVNWGITVIGQQWFGFSAAKAETKALSAESRLREIQANANAQFSQIQISAAAREAMAKARAAEREADLFVITAKDNEQILISDGNPQGKFVAAHLQLSGQLNGKQIEPNPTQAAAWQHWNTVRTPQSLQISGPTSEQGVKGVKSVLPESINLMALIPPSGPNLDQIILGVSEQDEKVETLTYPLSKMVHVGVGGSSGWGKSVFLQALAYQIAVSPEPAQLALIDIEAQTFSPFAGLNPDRLRYPLADSEVDIMAILDDLGSEWMRRRKLYQRYPNAADLGDYNNLAHDPLPYIVLMIDEINMLTDDKNIVARLTKIGQGTRKYGIFCCFGGQNWNANDIPTKLRNNFSTRIQLKAMSKVQSRVMVEDSEAANITIPGRARAILPGMDRIDVQTPFVDKETLTAALLGVVARGNTPQVKPVERVVGEMYQSGASLSECYRKYHELTKGELPNSIGGKQTQIIKDILTNQGLS